MILVFSIIFRNSGGVHCVSSMSDIYAVLKSYHQNLRAIFGTAKLAATS